MRTASLDCNTVCGGNIYQECGGSDRGAVSVYEIGTLNNCETAFNPSFEEREVQSGFFLSFQTSFRSMPRPVLTCSNWPSTRLGSTAWTPAFCQPLEYPRRVATTTSTPAAVARRALTPTASAWTSSASASSRNYPPTRSMSSLPACKSC